MFETINFIEAMLWSVIGLGLAAFWCAVGLGLCHANAKGKTSVRTSSLMAAMTFALFGLSDIVEIQTGAWWRPWWLLVWKAVCVLVLLVLLIRYRRRGSGSTSG